MKKTLTYIYIIILLSVTLTPAHALWGRAARELAESILSKWTNEGVEIIGKSNGRHFLRKSLENANKIGGRELARKVAKYGHNYGPGALRVIDNAPAAYIKALDDLPGQFVRSALQAAQQEPGAVTRLVKAYGADALRHVSKHRGTGVMLIQRFGDEGLGIGKQLSEKQGIRILQATNRLDDIPTSRRRHVLETIKAAPANVMRYLEDHPRVLYTSAGVGAFLAAKDNILGTEKIVHTPEGSQKIKIHGFFKRDLAPFIWPFVWLFVLILAGWGAIKLWGAWNITYIKILLKKNMFDNAKVGQPFIHDEQQED